MKYYEQWKAELAKIGLTVDAQGQVSDALGNICAGEDRFGQSWSKDPRVNEITAKGVPARKTKKRPAPKEVETLEMVRARDESGHFVSDDPSTPDVNEAWVVKTVKKAAKKK